MSRSRTRAAGKRPRVSRGWSHDIAVAVITVITGLVLAWLTQKLPQEEIVKRALTRALVPVLGPLYGHPDSSRISIVTVDDADLKQQPFALEEDWPLRLGFLLSNVEEILHRKPRALFIDLLLKRKSGQDEIEALRKAICDVSKTTAVYIAWLGPPGDNSATEEAVLQPRYTRTGTKENAGCAIAVDPTITSDKLDQLQWEYPVELKVGSADSGPRRSAAMDIYCSLFAAQCPKLQEHPAALALVWPASSAATNIDIMVTAAHPGGDPKTGTQPICRNGIPPWESIPGVTLLLNFVRDANSVHRLPPCPYHQVIPLRALNGIGFSDAELSGAIANRIILLGADIVGTGDKIVSPVNGLLPGVHAHAMALDNLMHFEGRYLQTGEFDIWDPSSDGSRFVVICVIGIVVLLTLWNHYFPEDRSQTALATLPRQLGKGRRRLGQIGMLALFPALIVMRWPRGGATADLHDHFARRVSYFALNVVMVAAIFVIGYFVFRQGPLSMVEYVLFPFVAHFLHLGKTIADRWFDWREAFHQPNPWAAWAAATRRKDAAGHADAE